MSKTATPITRSTNSHEADVPSAPPETHQQASPDAAGNPALDTALDTTPDAASSIALRAGEQAAELAYVPLRALRIDERNVRKDPPTEAEIEELADLIEAQGLLQNLTVLRYDSPRRGKGKDKHRSYTHGVIAGGRRLRALLWLVQRGRITLDEPVLCGVVPAERALAVSMAENQGQKPMSIADTVQAFADMVAAGAGIEDIAICFGLTPLTVKRRLKLASVSPKLFAMYRAGEINMDVLTALSLADSHEKQENAWESLPIYSRNAAALRRVILGVGVQDHLVRFVGLEAYELAGGTVIRDLFSTEEEDAAHIGDAALMQRLAREKLEAQAAALQCEQGLAWVDVAFDYDYETRQLYQAAPTRRHEPSAEQAHQLGELQREQAGIDEQVEALYDKGDNEDGGEGGDTAQIDALEAQSQALQDRIDEIESQLAYCLPEIAALEGALLWINGSGAVAVTRHLLRIEDYRKLRKAGGVSKTGSGDARDDSASSSDKEGAGAHGLSGTLLRQLSAHKTEALQVALVQHPQAALAALAHAMGTTLLYEGAVSRYQSPTALNVSVQSCNWTLAQIEPELAASPAHMALMERVQAWQAQLPAEPADLLPHLLGRPVEQLIELLCLCAALSTSAQHGTAQARPAEALAAAVDLDMADWWQAGAANYLGRVPKALIAEALVEAGEGEAAASVPKLKKAEAVSRAEALLAGKRWLPVPLQAHAHAQAGKT